jgi:hypothetical protein
MDVVKAVEADVFGASEWAVDFLAPLVALAERTERAASNPSAGPTLSTERVVLSWRLDANRARLAAQQRDGKADERQGPVVAPPAPPGMDPLSKARARLFESEGSSARQAAAEAFVRVYEECGGTSIDEVLVALCLSNVLRRDHAEAADYFEVAAEEFERRAREYDAGWKDSARSCWFRAVVEHRLAGTEEKAAKAMAQADRLGGAGIPPNAFGDRRPVRKH